MDIYFVFLLMFTYSMLGIRAYKNDSLNNICLSKDTVKLGTASQSAMLISKHSFYFKKKECRFEVKAKGFFSSMISDEATGIFAVVQHMKLRRDNATRKCIDYVQFKGANGEMSAQLCDNMDVRYAMNGQQVAHQSVSEAWIDDRLTPNSFDDPRGHITVSFYIGPSEPAEQSELVIAFTAYKLCHNSGYRLCSNDKSKCIYEAFFGDGVMNCPYYDCPDEGGCGSTEPAHVDDSMSIGTHVLIGSATSLVVSFGIFICCIYTCRKYGKLCWAEEFATVRPPQTPAVVEAATAEMATLQTASAPPLQIPGGEDKDMPPSYESLFPYTSVR